MQIHLNTAGSGLIHDTTLRAMVSYLEDEAVYGAYEAEQRHAQVLHELVYRQIAAFIRCSQEDVAIFDNATRAWTTAISSYEFPVGSEIWITPYEYAGNILALQMIINKYSMVLKVIPLDELGDIDTGWIAANLNSNVSVISIVHVPSNCGIVMPVEEVGSIIKSSAHPPLFIVDACQSIGHLGIDVRLIGCDILTGAGRKFLCGPRGTGFAYLSPAYRKRARPQSYDIHAAELNSEGAVSVTESGAKSFELAEKSHVAILGLSAAMAHLAGTASSVPRPVYLKLVEGLAAIRGVKLIKPGTRQSGIVSFTHEVISASAIVSALRGYGINTWVANGRHTPVHMNRIHVPYAVRASVHYYNNEAHVKEFIRVLESVCQGIATQVN